MVKWSHLCLRQSLPLSSFILMWEYFSYIYLVLKIKSFDLVLKKESHQNVNGTAQVSLGWGWVSMKEWMGTSVHQCQQGLRIPRSPAPVSEETSTINAGFQSLSKDLHKPALAFIFPINILC